MSLFKILRGDSSRIDTSITPFHDGYAYFTPDDCGFYIDSDVDGSQKRQRINPPSSTSISAVLRASGWSSGKQTLTINDISADSNGVIGAANDITTAQLTAARKAGLYISGQGNGSLTIAAFGDVPTCDIPVSIVLIK